MNELKKSVSGLFSKNVNKTKSGAYFFPLEKKTIFDADGIIARNG